MILYYYYILYYIGNIISVIVNVFLIPFSINFQLSDNFQVFIIKSPNLNTNLLQELEFIPYLLLLLLVTLSSHHVNIQLFHFLQTKAQRPASSTSLKRITVLIKAKTTARTRESLFLQWKSLGVAPRRPVQLIPWFPSV